MSGSTMPRLCFESEGKKPNVRRCLFGRPNRETLEAVKNQQNNIIEQEADRFVQRWGFDPIKGKPVEGGLFECIAVSDESIPAFYSKTYQRRKIKPCTGSRLQSRITSTNLVAFLNNSESTVVRPVKRRLPLGDDENDENKQTVITPSMDSCSRVQMPTVVDTVPTPSSSVESSPSASSTSYPSPLTLSLKDISHTTPTHQTVQTLVKDYFPLHKRQRCSPKQSCQT